MRLPGSGCLAVANVHAHANAPTFDTKVDLSDAVYLLNFLFLGGPPPGPPFPDCGAGSVPSDAEMCDTPPESCGA